MDVILSIKPKHVKAIKTGNKHFEFRKVLFRKSVEGVYIYSTSPVKKITGYFKIGRIIEDLPFNLWEAFHEEAGITKTEFFTYYGNTNRGFAIEIKDAIFFDVEIDPEDFVPGFSPPQSIRYVEPTELKAIYSLMAKQIRVK